MATKPTSEPASTDECFFIAPIGEEGSDERHRSDGVFEYIVAPAALELGLAAQRADRIGQPGMITTQVIGHVLEAKAAVVDLTGCNPNVFYELAIRHTAHKPTALIAEEGSKLPFDIAQMRTIFFNSSDLKSANDCKIAITEHLGEALTNGATDSPVAATIDIQGLQAGSPLERTIAEVSESMDMLLRGQAHLVNLVETRNSPVPLIPEFVRRDLLQELHDLNDAVLRLKLDDDTKRKKKDRLLRACRRLERTVSFLLQYAESRLSLSRSRFTFPDAARPTFIERSPGTFYIRAGDDAGDEPPGAIIRALLHSESEKPSSSK